MLKEKIKELCLQNGTTVQKLEDTLNIGNGVISRWDKSSPKAENLEKIADYFGVSVDYLLGRSSDPHVFRPAYLGAHSVTEDVTDEQVARALALFAQMTDEEKEKALEQLEMVIALSKIKGK